MNAGTIKAISRLQPKLASTFLRRQITSSKTTEWYSPGPANSVVQREDAALLVYCSERNAWAQAERQYWSSMLCNAPDLALRSKKDTYAKWWYSLGTKGGASVLSWPLKELVHNGAKHFLLDPTGRPSFRPVLNYRDFEAVSIVWCGPLQQRAHAKATPKLPLLGIPSSKPRSLLEHSASNAFWSLSKTQLHQLIR
eukprot:5519519-Amphidinium_carterae.1